MRRALLALIAACHPTPPVAKTASGQTPRLVVLLVIDQWPEWAFEQKRPALHAGFDRLLREGAWHRGQHPSAATLTAAGHALFGTGEPPAQSGILANEWWHRDLDKPLKAVEDVDGSVSARWLRVPGIADVLAAEHPRAKAIAVSLKDRAAVLPLGHAGTPIWYDANKLRFVSTRPLPWLDDFERTHPVSAHLHDVWTPLDPAKLAELSGVADDRPQEVGHAGIGNKFPHALADSTKPAEAVIATPLGNDLVFDRATAAIDAEKLGADDIPDYLVISLSAHDYVGHGWGQESWEAWDMMLRLDTRLQQFLDVLDRKVGAGRWVMIATSDHGAAPDPKSKIRYGDIKKAANLAAQTELGGGDWIADARYPSVYFTDAAIKAAGRDLQVVIRKVVLALRAMPGLGRVERMADVAGHCDSRTGDAFAICLAVDPERSGEIFYMPAEGTVMEDDDEPVTTAHGSIHPYDRIVPVIMVDGGPPHAPLAHPDDTTIEMVRIAWLVSRWLGITPPTTFHMTHKE